MSGGEPHFQGFSDREIKVIQQKQHGGRGGRYPAYGSMGPPQKTAHFGPGKAPPQKTTRGSATRRQNSSGGPSTPPSGATDLPKNAYFVETPPTQDQREQHKPMQSCKDSSEKASNGEVSETGEVGVRESCSNGGSGKEGGEGALLEGAEERATAGERERELSDQ